MHSDMNQRLNRASQLVEEQTKKFNQFMGDIANGRLTISVQWSSQAQSSLNATAMTSSATDSTTMAASPSFPASSDHLSFVAPPHHPTSVTSPTAPSFAAAPAVPSANPTSQATRPPFYKLSTGVVTVHDLWREWHSGLSGGPAVKDLELQWGTEWRKGKESKKYICRKAVIDGIKNFMEIHAMQEQTSLALDMVERWRQQPKPEWCTKGVKPKSLDWMGKNKDTWKNVEMFPL